MIRSGRLDRHIRIGFPDETELARILREHLGDDLADVPLGEVALLAVDSSGADCERYVRTARRLAREAKRPMTLADLVQAVGGAQQPDEQLCCVAVHEAGHAVVTNVMLPGLEHSVALRAASDASGISVVRRAGSIRDADLVHTELMRVLAGRAAEEVMFGRITDGSGGSAGSDLSQATLTATRAATAYGLLGSGDLRWRGMPDMRDLREFLRDDAVLAKQVGRALDRAYADVLNLLRIHRRGLEAVATALMEARALSGETVSQIVEAHRPTVKGGIAS